MQYIIIAVIFLVILVIGVGCFRGCGSQAVEAPGISSGRIKIQRYELKAGRVDDDLIRRGLTALSEQLAGTIKPGDSIEGVFDGTLHWESSGTIRMFAIGNKAVKGDAAEEFVRGVVPAMFGCKFPSVGQDVLLYVAFQVSGS
ncbi:MAG: hypothetical protein ACI8W8_000975 [Rhodothermales bacterium]|jgi:hypothetical protein